MKDEEQRRCYIRRCYICDEQFTWHIKNAIPLCEVHREEQEKVALARVTARLQELYAAKEKLYTDRLREGLANAFDCLGDGEA